jgi:hypothetical protein
MASSRTQVAQDQSRTRQLLHSGQRERGGAVGNSGIDRVCQPFTPAHSRSRVEGISASRTRVALACGLILAVTRAGVSGPGRAQAVVPPGEMLQARQLPPAVIRSPAGGPAARRAVCMATVSSSRVASCSRGAGA